VCLAYYYNEKLNSPGYVHLQISFSYEDIERSKIITLRTMILFISDAVNHFQRALSILPSNCFQSHLLFYRLQPQKHYITVFNLGFLSTIYRNCRLYLL